MDIRTQLPECPLEYEVPFIPGDPTAVVILIGRMDIDWQEKMLPWTLASLINNTDLIMNGVRFHIACEEGTEDRIRTAISNFDFGPDFDPIRKWPSINECYDSIVIFDINYWAFRDGSNTHKLAMGNPLEYLLDLPIDWYPSLPVRRHDPRIYNMTHCTIEQFRHAIKDLMAAQLAMEI